MPYEKQELIVFPFLHHVFSLLFSNNDSFGLPGRLCGRRIRLDGWMDIAINSQWPNPTVRAKVGDTIRVTARNGLGNETLSFHWHGLFQKGSNAMDGPMQVTQCPILPGQSYTYEFQVRSPVNCVRSLALSDYP